MTKMILTLVALAALGTAALAPTDASAFRHPAAKRAGGVHHAGRPAARPAHVRNFNIRIRLGARPAWHRGAVHGPVRFGYRPVWHRPGFVRGVGYAAPVAAIAAAPIATAPVQRAMGAQVNGMNVTMVAVPDGQFNMTGQGQWTRQVNNGKVFQFAEVGRDASSVTLNDAARGIQVILDLGQRKVLLAAANGTTRPLFPIVNASAR